MSFAVGFDVRLPYNSMEPKELLPVRIVQLYMEPQKCQECPWEGIIIISRTWRLSSRVISGLAVGHEIWFGWLERTLFSFCKTLKGIKRTKANDARVIFQCMTLTLTFW